MGWDGVHARLLYEQPKIFRLFEMIFATILSLLWRTYEDRLRHPAEN
jgi:hypothetical protein